MEVLGAVAATGQLIGTIVAVLDSINRLREFLRHAPARCQEWQTQLDVLTEAISFIRENSLLEAGQVGHIITGMPAKITTLTELCALYAPQPKLRLYGRLIKALSAKGVECRIPQNFQSLKQNKSTLILIISTIRGSIPIENYHFQQEMEDKSKDVSVPSRSGGM
ncbi:hypothetical protein F4677DRAFT_179859 [Hypoxylon crocopeplum]|nr:hypothetical protein F4677DRAFT_179859 [Hypoxylon crocopeplum]